MTTERCINSSRVTREVKTSFIDRFAKRQILKLLRGIEKGRLVIEDAGEVYTFGQSISDAELTAQMFIHHSSAWRDILFGGSIGGSEAYMLGSWSSSNLVDVIRLMSINLEFINQMDSSRWLSQRLADKLYHLFNRNTEANARANISAHYDLSNEFFSLFLDQTMMYSAAIYPNGCDDLYCASVNKLDTICQKLNLTPSDHLLEIGTGWGGLAVHAAKHYGCKVTTTTISQQQYQHACEWVERENLGDRITVLRRDYRELEGHYDKLVSIEMIEAVGHEFYRNYFSTCSKLLKENGLMLIQAITIADQRYDYAKKSVDFIQKYIFPGGCLPSNEVIGRCIRQYTDMQVVGQQEIGEDYATTLQHWRQRFHAQLDEVKKLGFDDIFIRMWEYYLCYCEGGFRERAIGTSQYLFAKPGWRKSS